MDVKNNPEKLSTTKVGELIFYQVFQCLQYRHLKEKKISIIMYIL